LDATLQMMKLAKHTHMINSFPEVTGDAVMRDKAQSSSAVTILNNAQVVAIEGDKFVNAMRVRHEGKEERLAIQGVFIEIGLVPNSDFAQEIKTNDYGEIKIDYRNQTNIPGVFAAGDVTNVPEKQIIIAAGEGAKACLSAFRYLAQQK
jgi:alkyl hydroperoxide reductase subunit AhpF